ncbi:hypothetical protein Ahy_A05g021872 isoform E [Arachis hypogaea]|uniref:Uncharacterized protein n=1 Tax=Arachis hypogaea TaxID=3818 RepID=A0A445CYY6_ARAHY|nr:hypothetical protein Ahy_A05g021872 isoform E [Arachis hypogaea]
MLLCDWFCTIVLHAMEGIRKLCSKSREMAGQCCSYESVWQRTKKTRHGLRICFRRVAEMKNNKLEVERTVAGFRVLLPSTKKEQLTTISGHRSREWRALRSISHPYYLQRSFFLF